MSNNSSLTQIDAVTTTRTLANHRVVAFWHTMVGKKVVRAVTGVVLILFVIAHMLGNLKIFSGPDEINEKIRAAWQEVLSEDAAARLWAAADTVFAALSVRDLGRADFRVGEDGAIWFLEVNPLPSLEEGAGLYAAAELLGLGPSGVIEAVVESARRRRPAGVAA